MTLSFCLQAAALHDEDSSALTDAIERYVKAGMGTKKAQLAAIADVKADVRGERDEILAAVSEQHPAKTDNPFKTFLMRQGVKLSLASEFTPGTKERLAMGRTFRKNGLELDALAEQAAEQGYIKSADDVDALYDLISKAVSGERVAPLYGHDAEQELQARVDRQRAKEEDVSADLARHTDAEVYALEDADIPWDAIASTTTEADAMRSLGFTEQEISHAAEIANRSQAEAGAGRDRAQAGETARGEAQGSAAGRDEQAGEALSRPSKEDVLAAQGRREQGDKTQARADREADQRNQADRDLPDFGLTGSDRGADANPDQGAMFSRAPATDTPAFKKWFGDSKVVDKDGKPLVVYHGTVADISTFKTTRSGEFGPAIYTTDNPHEAAEYGVGAGSRSLGQAPVNVMPVYVSLKHPFVDGVEAFWKRFNRENDGDKEAVQRAIADGFDGVIAKRPDAANKTLTHYIAFHPEQIKSATGNNGDFNSADPRINFKRSEPTRTGLTAVATSKHLAEPLSKLSIPHTIHDTVESARADTGVEIPDGAKGMHYQGEVHLFAENLRTPLEAEQTFWHEVQHAGLNESVGKGRDYENALRDIALKNSNIRTAAKEWMTKYGQEDYDFRVSRGMSKDQAMLRTKLQSVDEALAEMSGSNSKINGIAKLIAKVQDIMRSLGLHKLADALENKTDAQALAMILRSRDAVMGGDNPKAMYADPAFHRAFHGSPHDFDEFSTDKIGTGEGAQSLLAKISEADPGFTKPVRDKLSADLERLSGPEKRQAFFSALNDVLKRGPGLDMRVDSSKGGDAKSASANDVGQGAVRYFKQFSDLISSDSFVEKGYGGIDAKARSLVVHGVFDVVNNLKIRDAVIELVPVDVVNILGGSKAAAKAAFNDVSVLKDILAVDLHPSIATVNVAGALVDSVALLGAKKLAGARRSDLAVFPENAPAALGAIEGWHRNPLASSAILLSQIHPATTNGAASHKDGTPVTKAEKADYLKQEAPSFSHGKTADASDLPDEVKERKPYAGPGAPMLDGAKGILNEVYMALAPMSAGGQKQQAGAQNFVNHVRDAQYQWKKVSDSLKENFTPEQRTRMHEAGEEQNSLLLEGKSTKGKGLDRLSPDERKTMETLHQYSEELWQRGVEAGLVTGEGVPFWTPRSAVMMGEDGTFTKLSGGDKQAGSGVPGRNVFTTAPSAKQRKHDHLTDSEAALKAKFGDKAQYAKDILTMPLAMSRFEQAIAGRELINSIKEIGLSTGKKLVSDNDEGGKFFQIPGHPAFTTKSPEMTTNAEGKTVPRMDQNGVMMMKSTPLFIDKSYEGPLKAVMSTDNNKLYTGYMLLKSKEMSAIMFSPLIHLQVVLGKAFGFSKMLAGGPAQTMRLFFSGHAARKDMGFMRQLIGEGGMVPIGEHNSMLDVGDIANGGNVKEGGWLDPNESWLAKGVQKAGDSIHQGLGTTIKEGKYGLDAAGDFVHNTLLWRRVADLQTGIAKDAYETLLSKGFSHDVAIIAAAHLANRYAGVIGQENMSKAAHMAANVMLFSKSFNATNVGVVKDTAYGAPAGLVALIKERASTPQEAAKMIGFLKNKARFALVKDAAYSIIAMNLAAMWFQRDKDSDWGAESIGRGVSKEVALASKMWMNIQEHPTELASYDPRRMSGAHDNEPGKDSRVFMGLQESGRGQYMRLPSGKMIEDVIGWTTDPLKTADAKKSPLMSALNVFANKKDQFGTPIWDNREKGITGIAHNVADAVKFVLGTQVPMDQLKTAKDIVSGVGTPLDKEKAMGNVTGFSISQGHPGGPEAGVAAEVDASVRGSQQHAMTEVKDLLKHGKSEEAWALLEKSDLTPKEIQKIIQKVEDPKALISKSALKKFNQHATDAEKKRMDEVTQ